MIVKKLLLISREEEWAEDSHITGIIKRPIADLHTYLEIVSSKDLLCCVYFLWLKLVNDLSQQIIQSTEDFSHSTVSCTSDLCMWSANIINISNMWVNQCLMYSVDWRFVAHYSFNRCCFKLYNTEPTTPYIALMTFIKICHCNIE